MNHIMQAMERVAHKNFTSKDVGLWYLTQTAFKVRLEYARKLLNPWAARMKGKFG